MTPTPLSPQVQEWRDTAERLAMDFAHAYAFVGDDTMPKAKDALLSHLSAVPFNQVVQEPVAWEFRFFNETGEPKGWGSWERVEPRNRNTDTVQDKVREIQDYIDGGYRYELRALYAQPVRGEALPAEQPKSEIAYPVVAVGSDLPPALPEDMRHCGDPECDACEPDGPRVTPEPKTFWLIERGSNQQQSPTVWWSSRPVRPFQDSWVESVHKATRFDNEAVAREVAEEQFLSNYAITSHNFMSEAA